MFSATLPTTATGDRAIAWDAVRRTLAITTGTRRGTTAVYAVDEIECEGGRGFQLTKVFGGTDAEATGYACFVSNQGAGFPSCECRGFLRWGRCSHLSAVLALVAAGQL